MATSAGTKFRSALASEKPLQIAGTINAYCSILAARSGFRAIYLSGAGVANAAHGLPDLGFTTREQVVEEVRRITSVTDLPLLVDADTGWLDEPGGLAKTVRELEEAGAAAIHLEDQIPQKRCGHREGKRVVPVREMVQRIRLAVKSRRDPGFVIMARTDALAVEGFESAIARIQSYQEAGADMIFAEAMEDLEQYRRVCRATSLPVLANMTEFGVTPMFTANEFARAGVRMVLYPLSAFRAMNKAALEVYQTLRSHGTQRKLLGRMQTRAELYETLNYKKYERMMDRLIQLEEKSTVGKQS
jgi:methylisocitrate lyase